MKTLVLKCLRAGYRKVSGFKMPQRWSWPSPDDWGKTNDILYDLLMSDNPCMVSRVGTVEGQIIHNRLTIEHEPLKKLKGCFDYITGDTRLPWWDTGLPFKELQVNAGFFEKDGMKIKNVEKFADLYLHYIPLMDVCGRFEAYERYLPFSKECKMVQLESLYPFFVERPWMKALEGKKVLVIHPFKETIEAQYAKRKLLFKNNDCLPDFDLKVIKAVQSMAGEETPFSSWFEALDYMKDEISKTDFDVAIIGCGAYGLPLAGFIKEELHKKAIHMGGGTQLLFGIKGKRWISDYKDPCYRNLFNENWVFPNEKERPSKATAVEGGCYW